ncbi:MAG: glycoside hydrolase family 127 protein [Trueperaceae bacterium]|nr:glycoside hydrolase family 127 protein [Trueperaceae bacterium]
MEQGRDYPIHPVEFTKVSFEDSFWLPRLETNRKVTIPYDFEKCEATGRVDNFLKAAGKMAGAHTGLVFNDSDVFKVIEGAAFSLSLHPDAELDAYLDKLIAIIADAQEEDGYIYTSRTVNPEAVSADREGLERWSNLKFNHELYNLGHMYEAAVAHYLATGKRNFLDIAVRSADLIDRVFGPDKKRDVPGHQEVELGLVKLYRVTGDERYLKLAKFFLDERGHYNGREENKLFGIPGYAQDHLPVTEQTEAVGHSVRAAYMYAGMADVAALTGDEAYIKALDAIWENVVYKKLYLTGGIGARHHGESFGDDYELPNATAYTETCAAIANIYWNHRMFLLHGDSKYLDVLERTLYNGFLSGIALSGDTFFYPNPLESDAKYEFNRDGGFRRNPWFECSCCPTNIVRLLPALLGYVLAQKDDTVFVNLYASGTGELDLGGQTVRLTQETNYPWDGKIKLSLETENPMRFKLALRIPGWAQGEPVPGDLYSYLGKKDKAITLMLNGEKQDIKQENGFAVLEREWQAGDVIELDLPMPIERVLSHRKVEENRDKVAVERGPIVYCAEATDNGGHALDLTLADTAELSAEYKPDMLGGVTVIKAEGLTLIPYYAWAHRDVGEMAVWLKRG